jgi:hypothetical protein
MSVHIIILYCCMINAWIYNNSNTYNSNSNSNSNTDNVGMCTIDWTMHWWVWPRECSRCVTRHYDHGISIIY